MNADARPTRTEGLHGPLPEDTVMPDEFPVGQVLLGRYLVLRRLGSGGTGTVVLCQDQVTGVRMALKSLPAELAHNPSEMGGILENFRLVERLHHPRIAALKHLELDRARGRYFLVQEFVEGESLGTRLREAGGSFPWRRALALARQIGEALDHAHAMQIVHRDVKPANVIVDGQDRAKVVDFGIACGVQEALSTLTGGGRAHMAISGTAAYMPPEQWLGQRQGAATDQYSLAVTFHQMVCGKLPFGNGDNHALRERILRDEPVRPEGFPSAGWAALRRALSKDPNDRFPSCQAFLDALPEDPALTGKARRPASFASPFGGSWLAAAVSTLAAGILVAGYVLVRGQIGNAGAAAPLAAAPAPAPAVASPAVATRPRYHALVIGINDYTGGWERLANARADAEAVARVLETRYGFTVRTLLDRQASRAGLMDAFDSVARLGEQDNLLVYYAGHGHYDATLDEGFIIPSDGRKPGPGTSAKDGWIWNSTLSKIFNVSKARHILILADSCFSGSLFRGGDVEDLGRQYQWYKRAFRQPSRYVIASGDLERVSDGGAGGHSVFAKQILQVLENPAKEVFSASDIGNAIKTRVAEITGQHVRMGGLAMAANAGGEFVFLANPAAHAEELLRPEAADAAASAAASAALLAAPAAEAVAGRDWSGLRDLHELARTGATNSAARLAAELESRPGGDRDALHDRLLRELDARHQGERRAEIDRLVRDLERLVKERPDPAAKAEEFPVVARPRVLAFLPLQVSPAGADLEMTASFLSTALVAAFDTRPGFLVVDRANLEAVLLEQGLRLSSLSDQQAGFEIGKLLPASLLVSGQLTRKDGKLMLSLRLLDTATTRYLGTHVAPPHAITDLGAVVARAADDLAAKARLGRPLTAPLQRLGDAGRAGIGAFQRADPSMVFEIIRRPRPGALLAGPSPVLGEARIQAIGDTASDFRLDWRGAPAPAEDDALLVREAAPAK